MSITVPTNIPTGDRRPARVTGIALPAPAPAPVEYELFQSEDGKRWKLAGTDPAGGRLFVPEQCDPAVVKRWVWAKEAELAAVVGALTSIGRAA